MSRQERVTRRTRRPRAGLLDSLREGASDVVQSVVNEVAPGVVGALDVDEVIQRVDVQDRVLRRSSPVQSGGPVPLIEPVRTPPQ